MPKQAPTVVEIPLRGGVVKVALSMGTIYRLCESTQLGINELLDALQRMRVDIMADALAVMLADALPQPTGEAVLEEFGFQGLADAWNIIAPALAALFGEVEASEGKAGGESVPSPGSSSD